MIRSAFAVLFLLTFADTAQAQTLDDAMAGVAFLIGDWQGTGSSDAGTNRGTSSIHLIVGGNALMRKDHTDVVDANGKLQQSFDQVMIVYPEDGTLHADYLDGAHTIHYTHTDVSPGQSVRFETAAAADMPQYRLTYSIAASRDTMTVRFEMLAPGAKEFQSIAMGTLKRS